MVMVFAVTCTPRVGIPAVDGVKGEIVKMLLVVEQMAVSVVVAPEQVPLPKDPWVVVVSDPESVMVVVQMLFVDPPVYWGMFNTPEFRVAGPEVPVVVRD